MYTGLMQISHLMSVQLAPLLQRASVAGCCEGLTLSESLQVVSTPLCRPDNCQADMAHDGRSGCRRVLGVILIEGVS